MKTILVTGGAGFIGGCFVRRAIARKQYRVVNLDALTYAGNLEPIPNASEDHVLVHGDIRDGVLVKKLLDEYRPWAIVNFAAESHVDRSIDRPAAFVETNIVGTSRLLEASLDFWRTLTGAARDSFRFMQISTDEVFGSLGPTGLFQEGSLYAPNSPYAASKASADHLVRAWHHTYGLPTVTTNCSNNYGPYQFPEKLIPLMILNAIEGKPLPVYGDGLHIRDWLYVDDHCQAAEMVLEYAEPGKTYIVGGNCEMTNIDVVKLICETVQELVPQIKHRCEDLIQFVTDRPGHDRRYAMDTTKIHNELGWTPTTNIATGIKKTVEWYLSNAEWVQNVTSGKYHRERLGML